MVTDQRVQKVATTLHQQGYDVKLIGAKRKTSFELPLFGFETKRISLFFQSGFLMYADWNIRLFFYLLFQKADILLANDLDTLLPNFLMSKLRSKKLVYDSHEYFTEQEELVDRPFVKNTWLKLERFIFPKLKNVYTVNKSIADIYTRLYGTQISVIKNLPKQTQAAPIPISIATILNQLKHKRILLTQGTGINANRGVDELIDSVHHLPNLYVLIIIGRGLVIDTLKQRTKSDRIYFIDVVPPNVLKSITSKAYLGFTLDKATCLNYEYSLPNKLFDFIQAGVPIVASNRVEIANIVHDKLGVVINDVTAKSIADAILSINDNQYNLFKSNCNTAAQENTWERQAPQLITIFNNLK